MKRVTIRVPATTANLGPGFDAFGCALSLHTDVTFEETEYGLEITGCPEEFTGPDNLAYTSYCAVLASMNEEVRGIKIHIDAHIPVCRGLGSSAALLVAGAMGANVLRGKVLELYREDIDDEVIFAAELIGMEVFAEGENIGKIREVLDYPGNAVYVVKGEHEYMIPAVKEFILDTDMEANRMRVKLLEGMRSDEN